MLGIFASAQRRKRKAKLKKKKKQNSGNFRNCERQFWKGQMSGQRCLRNTH